MLRLHSAGTPTPALWNSVSARDRPHDITLLTDRSVRDSTTVVQALPAAAARGGACSSSRLCATAPQPVFQKFHTPGRHGGCPGGAPNGHHRSIMDPISATLTRRGEGLGGRGVASPSVKLLFLMILFAGWGLGANLFQSAGNGELGRIAPRTCKSFPFDPTLELFHEKSTWYQNSPPT